MVAGNPDLKTALQGIEGVLLPSFCPQNWYPIDAVIIAGGVVFVVEFKAGESKFRRSDLYQTWDYALDLKNFHQASHEASVIPLLVATEALESDQELQDPHADGVYPPSTCNSIGLARLIQKGLMLPSHEPVDGLRWAASSYLPTPTIIAAAQALYSHHSVEAIARHDAGARNLYVTSQRVEEN